MKFDQNPPFGSGDRVQTSFLFWSKFENFKVLVWPWKWGQGHKNLITSFSLPIMCLCKFGENPPIGSGDRVQKMSTADAGGIRTKSNMPPSPSVEGRARGGGRGQRHNDSLSFCLNESSTLWKIRLFKYTILLSPTVRVRTNHMGIHVRTLVDPASNCIHGMHCIPGKWPNRNILWYANSETLFSLILQNFELELVTVCVGLVGGGGSAPLRMHPRDLC